MAGWLSKCSNQFSARWACTTLVSQATLPLSAKGVACETSTTLLSVIVTWLLSGIVSSPPPSYQGVRLRVPRNTPRHLLVFTSYKTRLSLYLSNNRLSIAHTFQDSSLSRSRVGWRGCGQLTGEQFGPQTNLAPPIRMSLGIKRRLERAWLKCYDLSIFSVAD